MESSSSTNSSNRTEQKKVRSTRRKTRQIYEPMTEEEKGKRKVRWGDSHGRSKWDDKQIDIHLSRDRIARNQHSMWHQGWIVRQQETEVQLQSWWQRKHTSHTVIESCKTSFVLFFLHSFQKAHLLKCKKRWGRWSLISYCCLVLFWGRCVTTTEAHIMR